MNGPEILAQSREQLTAAMTLSIADQPSVLPVSPWIAMSLLQKAVRRGLTDLALLAATTLLNNSPERLWRRLGGITFEDIGVADLEAIALVVAGLAGKTSRRTLGSEWAVASFLVARLAGSRKCRSADDLLMATDLCPEFALERRELARETTVSLLKIMVSSEPLTTRAIALRYALGTDKRSAPHLLPRRGSPSLVFDHLCDAGFPDTIVEIAREAYRKQHDVLAPLVALLCPIRQRRTVSVSQDDLPQETMVGQVPGWCLDLYTREGRRAFEIMLAGSSETTRWIGGHVPPSHRVRLLGNLVFRVEGGLVDERERWPEADELRRLVDARSHGRHCPDATELLAIVRNDLPALQEARQHVL